MIDELSELRATVRGPVLSPADSGYDDEVFAFNVAVQHRPDAVVGALDADDVAAAVGWAAERAIPIAVQATGHGATQAITGGLLISTRRLQDVEVDPEARTARVGAGVKWATLLAQTVPLGLVGLNGSSTDVGIVGYTLGGGLPIFGDTYGFSADHVRSFEVVTADGVARFVDAESDPLLFDMLRGGKGNLAIVTAMTIELIPLEEFYGGGIFYPGEDVEEVLSAFRSWAPALPPRAETSIALQRLPDMPEVPEMLRNRFTVHVRFAFAGPAERGDELLAPMRAVSAPLLDNAAARSYLEVDMVHLDPTDPIPYEEGGTLLRELDDDVQRVLLEHAGPDARTPLLMVELRPMGGELARPRGRDAISGRDAGCSVLLIGVLAPPIAEAVPVAIKQLLSALEPYSTGHTMVNFHGRPGDATDRARAWSAETYGELAATKRRYDPDNLLRFGHAILLPSEEETAAAPSA